MQRPQHLRLEDRNDQQQRIGLQRPRFVDLILLYDEVLAQNRQRDTAFGARDEVGSTLKVILLGQHADGRGSSRHEILSDCPWVKPDHRELALRRAGPLDFGNQRHLRAPQRCGKVPRLRQPRELILKHHQRTIPLGELQLAALACHDLV